MEIQIVVGVIVGIIIIVLLIRKFQKKKGSDTPESLKEYFSVHVKFMQLLPPLDIIFKEYSNDGNQIVYKEITKTRNCFLRFERYKLILNCLNEKGEETFYAEKHAYGGMPDTDFIERLHDLYVNQLNKGKILISE